MDRSYYDPKPIFCMWILLQKSELYKDIRKKIIQNYMAEKRERVAHIYAHTLRKIDISPADLMLLKHEYVEGFHLLNYVCTNAWRRDRKWLGLLDEKEYQTICELPIYLKNKCNVNPNKPNSVKAHVERDIKEIFFNV